MKGSLIGEFAKNKIEELVSYLKGKESDIDNNDEAQQLIDIIGEPIIKSQLQIMLNNKKPIKEDEAKSIKKEIMNLEAKLKEIENADNKD